MGGRGGSSGLSGISRNSISKSLGDVEFKKAPLPSLEGSQRQIEWAEKIRDRVLKDMYSYAAGNQSDGHSSVDYNIIGKSKDEVVKAIESDVSYSKTKEAKEWRANYTADRYKDLSDRIKRVNEFAEIKSASWWIDYAKKYEGSGGKEYRNTQFKKYIDGKIKLKKPLPR